MNHRGTRSVRLAVSAIDQIVSTWHEEPVVEPARFDGDLDETDSPFVEQTGAFEPGSTRDWVSGGVPMLADQGLRMFRAPRVGSNHGEY